jgi:hypothetical protein
MMQKFFCTALGVVLTLGVLVGPAAADWLFDHIFNNAIGGSQGVTGLNPFQLGSRDFLLGVAQNGSGAFLSTPGFVAGAAGLSGQFNAQAQQWMGASWPFGGFYPSFQPNPAPFFGNPLYFGDASSVRQLQQTGLALLGLNPIDPLNVAGGGFRCSFYPGQPC